MKILLLEDEQMLSEAIHEYLLSLGHRVELFFDGAEALDALKKETFDLLILDINVPGIDGLDLLEQLHALKIRPPAIYISALVDIEGISRAYDLGCYDYLKKPFHLKELALRIDKVMQSCAIPQNHLRLSKSYGYDASTSTLMCDNVTQTLTKRQLQIIDLLARNRGRVVDFDQFRAYVWDEEYVDNATIRAEVSRFKKSLKEDFIQNIRALGYMIDIPRTQ
ncbi:two component transcriptional regulator, winged helix family [Sulfuricurvum kujiense DSM 16994]|uniref:Two component transcriptional regulator, winged helix family n=1 Tax=Sulfuricurvum kujiense (strain ATCC BAA-921 / DSM 16994 / JCM 11577 / YK-1) TaxID=709032 RepID=E4U1F8_SULKY|nr:response regulator transcription factor [Sulfuricurvum kujiense]ADR34495.1 two component transcriptional regulator, winged helix family [Sulfuricurvum kujiense DSM 16994]